MAQIQIKQTDATQKISQPRAELTIRQPEAEITMRTVPGKLTIDQSQAWEDMNLLSIVRSNEKYASDGKKAVLEGIARRARQGNELMEIEKGGNPIPRQAVQNAYEAMKQPGIKFIPSHFSVKTDYRPSELNIDVKINKPIIEAAVRKPEIAFVPGKVETSLRQRQELEISFTNLAQ